MLLIERYSEFILCREKYDVYVQQKMDVQTFQVEDGCLNLSKPHIEITVLYCIWIQVTDFLTFT